MAIRMRAIRIHEGLKKMACLVIKLKKIGYVGLAGASMLAYTAQEQDPQGVDQVQAYFGVGHERDDQAWKELQDWEDLQNWLWKDVEQEGKQLEIPAGDRFMASEPRRLVTPVSPKSLSGDYADEEESSGSGEGAKRSLSISRSSSEDGGSENGDISNSNVNMRNSVMVGDGYSADLDDQGRHMRRPRLVRQEKVIIPSVLAPLALRARTWTYTESAHSQGQQESGGQAYREPTNDHRKHMGEL